MGTNCCSTRIPKLTPQWTSCAAKMKPVIEKHSEKVGADTVKEVYDTLAKLRAAK